MDIRVSLPAAAPFKSNIGIPSNQQPSYGDNRSTEDKQANQGQPLLACSALQPSQIIERSDEPTDFEKFVCEHPEVEMQLRQLDQLHTAHRDITRELQQAVHEVEKKYLARYQELYDERNSVINNEAQSHRGIPGFWLQVLKNNPLISAEIEEHDEQALKYLRDIRLEYLEKPGFALHFEFEENEFFEDRTLTKTFAYVPDDEHFAGDLVYGEVTGCEIHWRDGKDFTKQDEYDEDGKLLGSYVLTSFFDFFETPDDEDGEDEDGEDEEEEDEDEEEEEEEEEEDDEEDGDDEDEEEEHDEDDEEDDDDEEETWQEIHFAIGEEFSEKIIPYALQWYTGEAALYESDDDDEEDDEDEDEEEDE